MTLLRLQLGQSAHPSPESVSLTVAPEMTFTTQAASATLAMRRYALLERLGRTTGPMVAAASDQLTGRARDRLTL